MGSMTQWQRGMRGGKAFRRARSLEDPNSMVETLGPISPLWFIANLERRGGGRFYFREDGGLPAEAGHVVAGKESAVTTDAQGGLEAAGFK
ncbi:unnamed protein product [Caretta caretta]